MPDATEPKPRLILDAMILAAGLTSRRDPASHSRRLIELVLAERIELVLTETLIEEATAVLTDEEFSHQVSETEALTLMSGLILLGGPLIADSGVTHPGRCDDPDDDYLVAAALSNDAFLATYDREARFEKVEGLLVGRPGRALRLFGFFGDEEPPPT